MVTMGAQVHGMNATPAARPAPAQGHMVTIGTQAHGMNATPAVKPAPAQGVTARGTKAQAGPRT